ncbi:MAG: DNA replication/repair protein RecF [Saprospiraceae bacterium]
MHLQQLKLTQFKNYSTQKLDFSARLNAFVGMNGMGKTNLLDAIYYLCMCKSHFGTNDRDVVQHEEEFLRLEGYFLKNEKREKVVAKVIPRKKKEFERNDVAYAKLSEHIGLLPVVFIAPDDTYLAKDGSEARRRFLDNTLSQLDREYLRHLINYNKVLKQRNAALKNFAAERYFDPALLLIYNEQMLAPAAVIHDKRTAWMDTFNPLFQEYYRVISGDREAVGVRYRSQLTETDFNTLLTEAQEKDRILQRSTVGVHKDDLVFTIEGYPLKKFSSQGQLKSFVLALKLAQYELLRRDKAIPPLLLLDDIFDKLDRARVRQLLQLILEKDFGQIFITDTHESRLAEIIEGFGADFKIFKVENGKAN